MIGRQILAIEFDEALRRTAPGEAIGKALNQHVVDRERERRVSACAFATAFSSSTARSLANSRLDLNRTREPLTKGRSLFARGPSPRVARLPALLAPIF